MTQDEILPVMTPPSIAKQKLKEAIRQFSYRENHAAPFTLASGKTSPYYFDLKQTLLEPEYLSLAGEIVASMIAEVYRGKVIAAGLTMGADPIIYSACLSARCAAGATAENPTYILPAIVRKEAKDHGTGKKIEMLKRIDAATPRRWSMTSSRQLALTRQAYAAMREAGFSVQHAFCILDRGEGGREALLSQGVELLPVFTAAEFREK